IGFAGNDIIETILESDERFYLEPMFISLPDFAGDVAAIDPDGPSNRPYFTNVWLAADMNNDSFDDLVIGGPRWENGSFVDVGVPLQVLLNDGNGFFKEDAALVFGSENAIPRPVHAREGVTADFNRDGFPDIAIASHGADFLDESGRFPMERNFLILSQPNGKYSEVGKGNPAFDYLGFTHSLAVGDIDSDGDVDIVFNDLFVQDEEFCMNLRILVNDGSGNFTHRIETLPDAVYADQFCPSWLSTSLVDMNGDTHLDLVLGAGRTGDKSVILFNDGAGVFNSPDGVHELPSNRRYVLVPDVLAHDVNMDGRTDLILSTTREEPFYEGRYLRVLIQNRDGDYIDETSRYMPQQLWALPWVVELRLVDLNNDDLEDLLLLFEYSEVSSRFAYLRAADGSFKLPAAGAMGAGNGTAVNIDVDGDQDTDLVFVRGLFAEPEVYLLGALKRNDG
ncbi:MAG: VCBS repeat-containing protein, partial [Pseudomonadota bacterium]